jgi:adenylate kinase
MRRYIVLLGAPGAGKGTQAKVVTGALGLAHVSSGDLFRENLKNRTELGLLADSYIKRGHLVPDEVTVGMVRQRLEQEDCSAGAVLDGFPRTPAQAEAMGELASQLGGEVVVVLLLAVSYEELTDRLCGRRLCRAKGHIYHVRNHPPKVEGVCDLDGSELYQRADDQRATVAERLRVYLDQTQVLVDYYRQLGLLVEVNGEQAPEQVAADVVSAIRQRVGA